MEKTDSSRTDHLVARLQQSNAAYRAGDPILSDKEYDALLSELVELDQEHPYLHTVEPEPEQTFSGAKVRHATPMLSTDKAYTTSELLAFFGRVASVAYSLGIDPVWYCATPKLDGLSGRYDGHGHLSTRGNGLEGQDITDALDKGLFIERPDLAGDGEIVVDQRFFEDHLQGKTFNGRTLTHPRNFMVGFVGADDAGPHHQLAADAKAARFVPYATLGDVRGAAEVFLEDIQGISSRLRDNCPYLTDGIVIEVIDPRIRTAMGSTNHHHRWQIAYKTKGETADTVVQEITWQVGRTGRVTPVLEIEPVVLSGATIRRVTAHTAAIVEDKCLGAGARIRIIRSGEVIPKIEDVLAPAEHASLATHCPCCNAPLEREGEYLTCTAGMDCSVQVSGILEHFCRTLEIRGFGEKVVQQLTDRGIVRFSQILDLDALTLQHLGISPGIAANLEAELVERKKTPMDDWRVLAAFGIRHLGRGDAKKLLANTRIGGLNFVTHAFIQSVEGFGPVTAPSIASDIQRILPEINAVVDRLTIRHSMDQAAPEHSKESAILGKRLVFTGTFASADRKALEQQAEALGAKVQSSVNAKTDMLILGDKPGSKKVTAARTLSTPVISETEYRALIG